MSKLSQYAELPVSIRLTDTGQELSFVSSPKGGKFHISGTVGAETFEGFIKLEPIETAHPDVRWDVRLSFCVPADAADAAVQTLAVTKAVRAKPVVVDVDGAPATEENFEFTENEKFLLKDITVDPFEQTREINEAMPESTRAPLPGEEETLEKMAWDVRATPIEDNEEEATPPEDFIASEAPPSLNEEEELSERIAAKAVRGRRAKR